MSHTAVIHVYSENQKPLIENQETDDPVKVHNRQLDVFLREHQKQAYAIALISVHQEADALDVVQDAMMSFVNAYQHKSQAHWKPLFYRILQNKINDFHRKKSSWLRYFFNHKDQHELAEQKACHKPSPLDQLTTMETGNATIAVIKSLPEKQKQVVIYRHWQQMTVDETAHIMNISTGSVKTHLFRATQKIKAALGATHE